jgi:AcrR family transcriptional regulator
VRAIAKEADCSQGILSHYFDDKQDILASALRLSHHRVWERTEERVGATKGMAALCIVMLEALPLDEERELEACIEVSFWGRMLSDKDLGVLGQDEGDELWRRLPGHLNEARELGELRPDLDQDLATHELLVLIDGLSVERVHVPSRVPAERQLQMLDHVLRSFTT